MNKDHFEVEECLVGINKTSAMTNGDRIRAMSDEELDELVGWRGLCEHIRNNYYEVCETRGVCGGCVLNWLRQPCEVDK